MSFLKCFSTWDQAIYSVVLFFGGVGAAIGNHIFHSYLNGKPGGTTAWNEWNTRFSIAIAYTVKYAFKGSTTIAVVQYLWHKTTKKSVRIKTADAIFKLSPLELWRPSVWTFSGLLAITIFMTNLLAFTTILAPPTLGVRNDFEVRITSGKVPQINYTYAGNFMERRATGTDFYNQPHVELRRLALVTAATGFIQPATPPSPNAQYNLTFFGPSVKCEPRPAPKAKHPTVDNIIVIYYASAPLLNMTIEQQLAHLKSANATSTRGGYLDSAYEVNSACSAEGQFYSSFNFTGNSVGKWYIYHSQHLKALENDTLENGQDISECTLYNSTYDVEFQFSSGQQKVVVRNITRQNAITGREVLCNSTISRGDSRDINCDPSQPVLPFQSIFDSVGQLIVGWIQGIMVGGDGLNGPTRIFDTSLIYTDFFGPWRQDSETKMRNSSSVAHLYKMSLPDAIEQLVQNVTLGLFSSDRFLQESPQAVQVKNSDQVFVYEYRPRNLIIVYLSATVFTLMVLSLGAVSIFHNGATYDNTISTIIRTSRNSEFDALIRPCDTSGAQPIPEYLESVKIRLARVNNGKDGRVAFRVQRRPVTAHAPQC